MKNNKEYIIITIAIILLAIVLIFNFRDNTTSNAIQQEDNITPKISITSPENNYFSETNYITIKGTASDNAGIKEIRFKFNSNNWEILSGKSSWSKSVNLNSGENIIYVQAFDKNGNASPVESIRIYS